MGSVAVEGTQAKTSGGKSPWFTLSARFAALGPPHTRSKSFCTRQDKDAHTVLVPGHRMTTAFCCSLTELYFFRPP